MLNRGVRLTVMRSGNSVTLAVHGALANWNDFVLDIDCNIAALYPRQMHADRGLCILNVGSVRIKRGMPSCAACNTAYCRRQIGSQVFEGCFVICDAFGV